MELGNNRHSIAQEAQERLYDLVHRELEPHQYASEGLGPVVVDLLQAVRVVDGLTDD